MRSVRPSIKVLFIPISDHAVKVRQSKNGWVSRTFTFEEMLGLLMQDRSSTCVDGDNFQ
jgi:hypothetical protein